MARHFLYLTNERLVSLMARGGRIVARREFEVSGGGAAEFERYEHTLPDAPTHIITDLAEEDFRLDTVPHVGARDRDAVLGRKLTQIFRGTPYPHALLLGRESEGRRDDRVLYTAITNPEVLRPWLECLDRAHAPLVGIHSAAILGGGLLAAMGLVLPHTLLVAFTPGEAVRQTYFRAGEIRFSRLTPTGLEEGQSLGGLLAEETARTWQYLDSVRNFSPDERLEICVLVHPRERPAIERDLRSFAQIQYRLLDIEEVAAKLGLKPPPRTSSIEELLVHGFLRKPVENHFAAPELRRHALLRRARIAVDIAAALVLAASIAWGGSNLHQILDIGRNAERVARDVRALDAEFGQVTRSLPAAGIGGAAMHEAVDFYNATLRGFPSVVDFLVPLTRVFDAHPRIRLAQLAWQASGDAQALPTLAPTTPRQAPPVKAVTKSGEARAITPAEPSSAAFSSPRYQVALVEATVGLAGIDFRGALADVARLAEEIGRLEGYRAEVVDSPLETRPTHAIQGKLGERDPGPSEARFTLRIVRDRGPAA